MLRQKSRHLIRPTSTGRTFRLAIAVFAVVAACLVQSCAAQSSEPRHEIVEPQLLQLRDPEMLVPEKIRRLPATYLQLWIEALAGPEYELRRDVAMDITRAHRMGYLDCSTTADALANALNDAATPRSVLVEIARALITLDARGSSKNFKELLAAESGTQFELIVEPALARWGDAEMLTIWQQRVAADNVRRRRGLAIRSIAALPRSMTTQEQLHTDLRTLIEDGRKHGLALEAARTLGSVKRSELESLAEQLMFSAGQASPTQPLSGIYLLLHHESELSKDLLLRAVAGTLADPGQAPIVRAAWRSLLDRNVAELSSFVPTAIVHSDPEVRRVAIDTIVRFPSSEQVALLGIALDDRHPEIRRSARQALLTFSADDSLKPVVIKAGVAAIARTSWREQEQAVVLLAILDQSSTADRMLELIDSPRPEVAIAAAWGIRKLNVAEKFDQLLQMAQATDQQVSDGQQLPSHQAIVLAHMFEAFGRGKYKPAVPLLKRWIPKASPRIVYPVSRSSAVWSMGLIFENSKDIALAQQLKGRYLDVASPTPESTTVRHTAGVSLGRIGVVEVVPALESVAGIGAGRVDLAAAWAINRLTGRVFPAPGPRIDAGAPWKIAPIGSRRAADTPAR